MPRRIPAPEQLEKLRDIFRRSPPSTPKDFRDAAIVVGVGESAARKAYTRGWAGIESIESQLARERAVQAQQADVLKVERLVTAMKTNAVLLQNELRKLHPAVQALAENLASHRDTIADLPPDAAAKLLQRLAKVHKDVAAVSAGAIELDRLVAGEATSIVQHVAAEPPDLETMEKEVAATMRAIERERRKRSAMVLADGSDDGGTVH